MAQPSALGKHLAHDADQHRRVDADRDSSTVRWLVGEGHGDRVAVNRAERTVERLANVGVLGTAGGVVRASVKHCRDGVAGALDGGHLWIGTGKLR
jgi:hypothetical protein